MSFLKSLVRRVKRTVRTVATASIGGALSRAVGAALRPLGSRLTRGLGRLTSNIASRFRASLVSARRAGLDPLARLRYSSLSSAISRRAKSTPLSVSAPSISRSTQINLGNRPPKF